MPEMINDMVVFKMVVDHKAVKKALKELDNKIDTKFIIEGNRSVLMALLCSECIYVPENKVDLYIKYCKRASK